MTTSSSDRNRCTRISPSAVLDDRLDGKDLEWARDHLRRCEACRERVEDFREMLLRVGRLPSASVGATAMDQAFAMSIPERWRGEGGSRSFGVAPAAEPAGIPALSDLPGPVHAELTSAPDLLRDLEREIFRDEPMQDHPTPLAPLHEPIFPGLAAGPLDPVETVPPVDRGEAASVEVWAEPEPPQQLREIPVDSHRETAPAEWGRAEEPVVEELPPPGSSDVIFDQESAQQFGETAAPVTPAKKPDTAMRIAVGLGAAACVLLAAVLYEGGWLAKGLRQVSSTPPAVTSIHASTTVRPSASASASAIPSQPKAPVLFTLGNGVSGNSVYRIRPGTAVAGYTRLVFDMRGGGLPTMVITQPDGQHLAVTFKNTTVSAVPVNGIRSFQITAIEPALQQGADGMIVIDLARPVRVTAFTLPATAGYAWRLVIDVHTA
jgi:anti-sigma factor RsiW